MTFQLEMTEPEIDDFDQFWKAYPRRDNKKKARATWNRLSKSNKQKALIDLETRYIGIQKCFVPLPTTYLNGERWEDDPIPREENKPVEHVSSDSYISDYISYQSRMANNPKPQRSEQEKSDGINFLADMMKVTR